MEPRSPAILLVETTVDDPLAAPWSTTLCFRRDRCGELYEFVCAENDRNPVDEKGVDQFK